MNFSAPLWDTYDKHVSEALHEFVLYHAKICARRRVPTSTMSMHYHTPLNDVPHMNVSYPLNGSLIYHANICARRRVLLLRRTINCTSRRQRTLEVLVRLSIL